MLTIVQDTLIRTRCCRSTPRCRCARCAGHGSWLVDEEGNEWLDAYGGHAVASTGHCHPARGRRRSPSRRRRCSSTRRRCRIRMREQLAERLAARCPEPLGQGVLLQLGRGGQRERARTWRGKHTGRADDRVACAGGWHGRTVGHARLHRRRQYEEAARARRRCRSPRKVPFDDVAALEAAVDDTVAAVIVEPVQGIAGARDCSPEFLAGGARGSATERGAALIFDEIQCGVGRCGAFTAAEAFGVTPDALTLAKGLAVGTADRRGGRRPAGSPTGSRIGDLGSTFGGGPVACAAALANLEVIEREGLIANAIAVGDAARARRAARSASRRCRDAASCSASASTGPPPRCSRRSSRPDADRHRQPIRRCSGSCRRSPFSAARRTCCSPRSGRCC